MLHVSIVLVHFNTDEDTIECLESLTKLTHQKFKYNVIVVDNGSKDPFSLPEELEDYQIEVIRSEANLGFTGGNNLGIWHARKEYNSDYFLLLNNDTVVAPNFATELLNSVEGKPEVGLAVSKIYFYPGQEFHSGYAKHDHGKVLWYAGGMIDWDNLDAFHLGVDEIDRGHQDHYQSTQFATGCSMLIPREIIETVGLLDKRYFLYLEDVDYSIRVRDHGYHIAFCPRSHVWHKNAGSSGGAGAAISQYYQTRNRLFLSLIHGNWRIKLRAIRVLVQKYLSGQPLEKRAVVDLILGRMGKQPVL